MLFLLFQNYLILLHQNVLNKFDRVHLLGTAMVVEFLLYKDIKCIESIDTSNPVMAAIDGIKYTTGLHKKPMSNMNSCSNISINDIDVNLLKHNVKMFKEFLHL